MSISKIFIPNFVRVLTNERKYIEHNFYSHAPGVGLRGAGEGGGQNFSVGICDGAHRLRILVFFLPCCKATTNLTRYEAQLVMVTDFHSNYILFALL